MVSLFEIVSYILSCQIIQVIQGKQLFFINESLHRRPALTSFPLVCSLMVVVVYICIQIRLHTSVDIILFFLYSVTKQGLNLGK